MRSYPNQCDFKHSFTLCTTPLTAQIIYRYGFSPAINIYVAFGFDCLGFEADLNVCLEPGATCQTDSAPHAVAIRCGEGEFVPNTGPTPTPRTMPPPPSSGQFRI